MKASRLRFLLLAPALALPLLAHAHPGHDGDHDFVWDFEHITSHPLATILCLSILAAGGWAVWRLLKSRQAGKSQPAKRD